MDSRRLNMSPPHQESSLTINCSALCDDLGTKVKLASAAATTSLLITLLCSTDLNAPSHTTRPAMVTSTQWTVDHGLNGMNLSSHILKFC